MSTAEKLKKRGLTNKQKRFCDEYMKDMNAKWAAVRAGYSEKSAKFTGHENLSKPAIKRIIDERQKKLTDTCQVDAEKATAEAAKIAFANIRDYLSVGQNGEVTFKPFDHISEDKLAAIESVRVKRSDTKFSIISLKLYSKTEALDKLFRRLGLYKADNEQKAPHSLADILALIGGDINL